MPVTITLPSTSSILNIMNNGDGTLTYGAWTCFRIINQSVSQGVLLASPDAQTTIRQSQTRPSTSNTYTVIQVLGQDDPATVLRVSQDVYELQPPPNQFVTVQSTIMQTVDDPSLASIYPMQFDTILSQSTSTSAINYVVSTGPPPNNYLQIAAGVTALITVMVTIQQQALGGQSPALVLAATGQTSMPFAGVIAGTTGSTRIPSDTRTFSLSVVYTNTTLVPTQHTAYFTTFDNFAFTMPADGHMISNLNAVQIA